MPASELDWAAIPSRHCRATVNPVDPRAFEFVDELFGELLPHFTSRQMFAPMDEPQDLGKGRSKQLCDEKGFDRVYFEYVRDGGEDRREARARAALLGYPVRTHPE